MSNRMPDKKKDPFWFLKDAEDESGTVDPRPPSPRPPSPEPTTPDPSPPPSPLPPDLEPGDIYALLIGINDYPHIAPLRGCVADAEDIEEYCLTTLNTPQERIKILRNQEATRAGIISSIKSLGDNPSIQRNDPILIYYSGHGGTATAPDGWPARGKVQLIAPYDFVTTSLEDSPIDGQGILDLELAQLLNDLAKKKSNNITVIFDCCHSASGTRGGNRDRRVRGIQLPPQYRISQALVNQLLPKTRASGVAKGFDRKGLASHVLLAACKETEESDEIDARGAFTVALMKLLRDPNVGKLTYSDVILRIDKLSDTQHPQCEGVHQYRELFDGRLPSLRRQTFEIVGVENREGVYKLWAGEADGVMYDAIFAVYDNRNLAGDPLGYVQPIPPTDRFVNGQFVEYNQTNFTMCQNAPNHVGPPFSLDDTTGYAIQTDAGAEFMARLFLDLPNNLKSIFTKAQKEMQTKNAAGRQVEFVDSRDDNPDLVVTAQDRYAVFEIMDPECQKYGLTHMPFKNTVIDSANVLRVLRAIADFYFHLRRASKHSSYRLLSANVNVKCHNLVYTINPASSSLKKVLMPADSNTSLIQGGVLRVPSSEDTTYGFNITSNFDEGLYAAMFYFDMSDLSISRYYLPSLAKREEAATVHSIPGEGKSLTVGYGESGTEPRTFTVREGQDVDVGFLRLFVSTDWADWTKIEQRSPFIDTRGSVTGQDGQQVVGWGAKTIPVVITK